MSVVANSITAPTPSASGWMALLQEDDLALQSAAVSQLLTHVNTLWHQIAECLPDLESMAENTDLPKELRQAAAAVASRVFFHLQESQQALRLALEAGSQHFDPLEQHSPYVQSLVAAALDAYLKAKEDDSVSVSKDQLQSMVYRLMDASCEAGHYQHALGIALEAHETCKVKEILETQDTVFLEYAWQTCVENVTAKSFRNEALQVVADCLKKKPRNEAAYDLVVVHQLLNQPKSVAQTLVELLNSDDKLLGLQLCFDLMDTGDQAFVEAVAAEIPVEGFDQARKVLIDGFPGEMALSFLHKHSHADPLIMENLKKALEERSSGSRSSVLHHAAVMTHSYLYAGTTNDSFLRQHLDWMKKASNWAKFSATASLGVVHAGHITEAMHLLQPYLPEEGQGEVRPSGGFAEGGSLYALGLIHAVPGTSAAKRDETLQFIRGHLRASHANEVMSHGAALGVGLTAMGSADLVICKELKELLDTDSAVAGEAAGIGLGLVLVGTGAGNSSSDLPVEFSELVAELKNYARETQHEKIIRGIAMGLALINYGQEENADACIEEMRSDRDPIMRYGAQYAVAMAYCGTGSNKAIRILLHTAVSDVSDDVRMAAVLGLAFVLYKTPTRVPELVKLLLESFNPHVRYASCMAVGIAMAGTGNSESIALLEPMLDDMTDYVRQGALMGTAMIYMQCSDSKKTRTFRDKLFSIVTEKHQSTMTKMGAIMSIGIIDSGGRNCALKLGSRLGFNKMTSAVGLCLWLQHWHWFPMMHFWGLSLTPTFTIGLNANFQYPKKFSIVCKAKPSAFAYPKKMEEKKEEKKKRVETVTLSTTAKEKARLARKRVKQGINGDEMDVDTQKEDDNKEEETKEEVAEDKADIERKAPQPSEFRVSNPSRITASQSLVCQYDLEQRYRPIRPTSTPMGVIIVKDTLTQEDDELETLRSPADEPEGETVPPESFVWTPAPPKREANGLASTDRTG